MEKNQNWNQSGSDYSPASISTLVNKLPVAIFRMLKSPMGNIYLSQISEKFEFSHKIYGKDDKFIKRVKKTFETTSGNLGILLNGVKGTGKTVTCELIANSLNLPVILVDSNFEKLIPFINSLEEDVVLLFDEFEKTFVNDDDNNDISESVNLLSIMDGASKGNYRKVFLLTTNNLRVNENLLQRPGRIRYLKNYGNLTEDIILEILDDKLFYPEFKTDILTFISKLEIVTIDIVISIIMEVNIHRESPEEFKEFFNVKLISDCFYVEKVSILNNLETVKTIGRNVKVAPDVFKTPNEDLIESGLYINGRHMGYIGHIVCKGEVSTDPDYDEKTSDEEKVSYRIERALSFNGIMTSMAV